MTKPTLAMIPENLKLFAKEVRRIIDSSKTSISVMMAASASGELLPPFVVYKAKHRYEEWEENGPAGARYSVSKSGWFDTVTFVEWFRQILLPYFRHKDGQKVIIGDNLSSHITLDVIQLCEQNNIKFVLLPPNSTHICQPLDVSFFAPLKKCWRKVLSEWKMKKKGAFQKSDFPALLNRTLDIVGAKAKTNILSGFRSAGIFPLNSTEVLKKIPNGIDIANVEETWMSSMVELFKKTRVPEKRTQTKRKRIIPGRQVSLQDLGQDSQNAPRNASVLPEFADSEDDIPLSCFKTKISNLTLDIASQISIEEPEDIEIEDFRTQDVETENIANIELEPNEIEVENKNCDNESLINIDSFVIVTVPLANTSKYKNYVGKVLQKYGENGLENYLVTFLRKKKIDEEFYFYFPVVADESIIAGSEVSHVLREAVTLRRNRYQFLDLPKEIVLE